MLVLLVALRPSDPAFANATLLALRAEAPTILRPALLSENAVGALVRTTLGSESNNGLCEAVWTASGGNPLYVTELLRALEFNNRHPAEIDPAKLLVGGLEGIGSRAACRSRSAASRAIASCPWRWLRAAPRSSNGRLGNDRCDKACDTLSSLGSPSR